MRNVVVIGGFTESRAILEPVADEAVRQGFGSDAELLTLCQARKMDDGRVRRLMAGMNVIAHSAGVTAVPDARKIVQDRELPNDLIVVAAPEPRTAGVLRAAAERKTKDHIYGPTAHGRLSHLRVVAGNVAEMGRHPLLNRSLISGISEFSTVRAIDNEEVAANNRLGNFMMTGEVFYRDRTWRNRLSIQTLQRGGIVFEELPGGHDELLVDPAGVLRGVRLSFEAAGQPSR